jgi:flavin-dependent dehydrogenase
MISDVRGPSALKRPLMRYYGAALAKAGHRVVLFEREGFPRFHTGESLTASVNDVLTAIDARTIVAEAGFQQKWGATFMTGDGRTERHADFSIVPGIREAQTWQVERATFDHLLLGHARSSGVEVREQHRLIDVAFDNSGVTATVQAGGTLPYSLRAKAIIDASGRGGVLSRKFNLRVDEPSLRNLALFSHYSGVPRTDGRRAGDIRIVARHDLGWFWILPISETLMSVGVVVPRGTLSARQGLEPDLLLDQLIADTPVVARLLKSAQREWPVRAERDFSYSSRAYAGDRWVLAGDAGSFLDPVFSTGVAIALESGLEAGQAISAGLAKDDLSADRLQPFSQRQRQRYRAFRRFVVGFYTPEFRDLFFADDPPPRVFRALVTVFAGYWRPSFATRAWVSIFFWMVRMQKWLRFYPALSVADSDTHESITATR